MQTPKSIINKWSRLKENGDLVKLCALTDKKGPTLSRILAGKQETTSDTILLIKKYLAQKQSKMNKATCEDQD